MEWRLIRKIRPQIESAGFFVEEVKDEYFVCSRLDEEDGMRYHIYSDGESFMVVPVEK